MSESDASDKLRNLAKVTLEQRSAIRDFIKTEVNRFAQQTWQDIGENLSNKVLRRVTGRLASSIRVRVVDEGQSINTIFGTNVPYAAIHEFGGTTPPHDIRPKRAGALHFVSGGKDVFAKVVHHPGSVIPARPYMRPAIQENKDVMAANIRESVERMLEGFGHA